MWVWQTESWPNSTLFYCYHNPSYSPRWKSVQLRNTFPRLLCWLGMARWCSFVQWHITKSLSTGLREVLRWQLACTFTLPFPFPPVCVSIIVFEATQTGFTCEAYGEEGFVLVISWYNCHTIQVFSISWPLIVWKQTNRLVFGWATISTIFCYL